jgi:hypothetical protein
MIPARPGPTTSSKAEIRLFERLRGGLNEAWMVLHSVGLAGHAVKRWAEADFVLVGPKGVYCLEVKGGRVARESGRWRYTDGSGRTDEEKEGPFEQAAGEEVAIRRYLSTHRLDRVAEGRIASGWGVAFPDIRFEASGPDVEQTVVYDARDEAYPMSQYVGRLADHWYSRLLGIWGRTPTDLRPEHVERIVGMLRPDFDYRPRLADLAAAAAREILQLTAEQVAIMKSLEEAHRVVIKGSAGTGKTVLAIEESKRLAECGLRVLFVCFNVRLASAVRAAVGDNRVEVSHFHGLAQRIVKAAGQFERLPDADSSHIFQVAMPELAFDVLADWSDEQRFQALIIDEAQDLLRDEYLAVLDALLVGGFEGGQWRAFLDPKQNAFGGHVGAGTRVFEAAGALPFRLTRNCRNTEPIATRTSLLSGVELEETLVCEGPKVEELEYRDRADQRRRLERILNRLLSEGFTPQAITVLSRFRLENSCLSEALPGFGARITDAATDDSRSISFATISSFKGLESEVVVLVDVDDLESADGRRSVYLGASRARTVLVVLRSERMAKALVEMAEEMGRRLRWQETAQSPIVR